MLSDHSDFTDPKRALQLGVGLTSPLWSTFFLAAGAGMAFWAWNRWTQTAVEGVGEAGPAPARLAPAAPMREPEPQPDLTAPPAATEATPQAASPANDAPFAPEPGLIIEPVTEALIEAPLEVAPVAEALIEAVVKDAPVAEIPVAEPAPKLKPVARAKAAAKPADLKAEPVVAKIKPAVKAKAKASTVKAEPAKAEPGEAAPTEAKAARAAKAPSIRKGKTDGATSARASVRRKARQS